MRRFDGFKPDRPAMEVTRFPDRSASPGTMRYASGLEHNHIAAPGCRPGQVDSEKEMKIRSTRYRAKDNTFELADLANGTFTICNVGQFDVQSLAGIVRPEQACMLGLGTIEKKVVPNDDVNAEQIYKYAQVMTATLACDHRVIDGAVGAQWLASFKELVEDPLKMIL